MKKLHKLSVTHLRVLEIGQFNKTTLTNLANLPAGTIVDTALFNYIDQLTIKSNNYDAAMLHLAKSDETIKIANADKIRDRAVSAYIRQLSVYELSEVQTELDAYASLNNLMTPYSGINDMNYEQETNAIDNLLADLAKPQYTPHIATLNMASLVTRINTKNTEFKAAFNVRMQETASKPTYDVKQLRTELMDTYNLMANYVLAMANALNTEEFELSLNTINAVRTYYDNVLAHRQGNDETPIPPMPEA